MGEEPEFLPSTSNIRPRVVFYDDFSQEPILEPGARGFIVIRRRRRLLGWLRHLPGLRRWAYRSSVYPITVREEP